MNSQPQNDSVTDSKLIRQTAQGSRIAWNRFVNVYLSKILEWLTKAGFPKSQIEDLSQEIFIHLMSSLPKYRKQPNRKFRSWLKRVAINAAIDIQRTRRVPDSLDPQYLDSLRAVIDQTPEEGEEEISEGVCALATLILDNAKEHFTDRVWHAFYGMAVENRTSADVGEELGMSKDAVRQAKKRVIKRLKEMFDTNRFDINTS